MASMNTTTKNRMKTTNKSGHVAYKLDGRTKLVTMALTTMLGEPKFYGDNTDELIKCAEDMCEKGDGEFVAKLAVWARTRGNLRSVSYALIAVVGHMCSGEKFVRPAARAVASVRCDDGVEILATYKALYGDSVRWPHAIQRGVRDALESARPYSIAKYQRRNRDMTLRDAIRITHPVAFREDTREAIAACVDGTLPFPKSWETELSARGNTKEVWDELIAEKQVPFMACLRNLRNMIQAGADIQPVLDMLSDSEVVRKSRQLPFRFYSAYKELSSAGVATKKVTTALDAALISACDNVDHLSGRTAVLIDTSGSMGALVSRKSTVTCNDIAAVLGAMSLHISDDAIVIKFDDSAKMLPMFGASILGDASIVPRYGGWTDMTVAFDLLKRSGFDADRVIVISDNEVNHDSSWNSRSGKRAIQAKMDEYRKKVGHDVWCHAIDLQGYGTSQFIGPHTNIIAGWSEQVLRFVSLAESGFGGVVSEIEAMLL